VGRLNRRIVPIRDSYAPRHGLSPGSEIGMRPGLRSGNRGRILQVI